MFSLWQNSILLLFKETTSDFVDPLIYVDFVFYFYIFLSVLFPSIFFEIVSQSFPDSCNYTHSAFYSLTSNCSQRTGWVLDPFLAICRNWLCGQVHDKFVNVLCVFEKNITLIFNVEFLCDHQIKTVNCVQIIYIICVCVCVSACQVDLHNSERDVLKSSLQWWVCLSLLVVLAISFSIHFETIG